LSADGEYDAGATESYFFCWFFFLHHKNRPASTASATRGITTPIAALAPVDKPEDGAEVGLEVADVEVELLEVVVAVLEDGPVVEDVEVIRSLAS